MNTKKAENTSRFFVYQCTNPSCRLRFTMEGEGIPERECPRCRIAVARLQKVFFPKEIPSTASKPSFPVIEVLLDNLRSTWNVGAIFRSADGAGVARIHLCGISPTPENPQVVKTALGAEKAVEWDYHPDGLALALSMKAEGYRLIALEGGENSLPIQSILPLNNEHPILLVAGNEVTGIDPDILDICDSITFLPMLGTKNSLNVAVATGITLYLLRLSSLANSFVP